MCVCVCIFVCDLTKLYAKNQLKSTFSNGNQSISVKYKQQSSKKKS